MGDILTQKPRVIVDGRGNWIRCKGRTIINAKGWVVGHWERHRRTVVPVYYEAANLHECARCGKLGWNSVQPRSACMYAGYDGYEVLERALCGQCFWSFARPFLRKVKREDAEDRAFWEFARLVADFRSVVRSPIHKQVAVLNRKFGERTRATSSESVPMLDK